MVDWERKVNVHRSTAGQGRSLATAAQTRPLDVGRVQATLAEEMQVVCMRALPALVCALHIRTVALTQAFIVVTAPAAVGFSHRPCSQPVEIVAGDLAHEWHVQVGVGVNASWHDILAAGIYDLGASCRSLQHAGSGDKAYNPPRCSC
jgi:hypothetical protein